MNRVLVYILTFLLTFAGGMYELAAQCSQCKAAAASKDAAGNLIIGGGINHGVLYLLALPFILIFTLGGVWWWKYRQFQLNARQPSEH